MPARASQLRELIQAFSGGSQVRHRHALNTAFTYTSGVKAVADGANAAWLVDEVALSLAPKFASAWQAGDAAVGLVRLVVLDNGQARLTLELDDSRPPAASTFLALTDFPVGEWTFLLGIDEGPDTGYVINCMLSSEH